MKVLIADDEPVARQILRELLEETAGISIAGEASDGQQALSMIRELNPDVVLLDLQMPGLHGFQVADQLPQGSRPAVIFVTAFDKHALEAFNAGAVDYLLKPVRKERLEGALSKARKQLAGSTIPQNPALAQVSAVANELRKIVGKIGNDLHLLDPDEVIAFQAEGELVYIITAAGKYYANHTLKAIEERLPQDRFRRVHRSTIINTDQIRKISPLSSKRWLLKMSNGMEVIVSKRLSGVIRQETDW